MNRKLLRATLVGLVLLVALATFWPALSAAVGLKVEWQVAKVAPTTAAVINGACQTGGVTVVVDFGTASHQTPLTKCISSSTGKLTGWDLLSMAYKVQGTSQYPTGFVCRIGGFPSVAKQDCKHTPTYAEGSWAYYQATAGANQDWRPSMAGAAMTHPKCGSYEGWLFLGPEESTSTVAPRLTPRPVTCP